jgi:phage-related protein
MGQQQWKIVFFRSQNGRCPYLDFFNSLIIEDRVRIKNRLDMVAQYGPRYDEFSGSLKPHADDLFELRFEVVSGIVRLFYFYQPNHTIVITHGYCKKTQKTDRSEIQQAMQYRGEYLMRGKAL